MPIHASSLSIRISLWAALTLLASSYTLVGSLLAGFSATWLNLAIVIFGVILVTISLVFPQFNMQRQVTQWLRSDTSAFILLTVSAALVSVVLLWFHIFIKIITILAAGVLVKLELRHHRIGMAQSFWLLLLTSLIGVSLGWVIRHSI